VDNAELERTAGRSDTWILRRTGIVSRRYADEEETIVEMAASAARAALAAAGVTPAQIDMLLLACMSDLRQSPSAAPEVAHRLRAVNGGALDIDAACAGFGYGVGLADSLVRGGACRYVLLIGVDRMTDIVDPADSASLLFADGAGAVVIGPADRPDIGPTVWGADGGRSAYIEHTATWLDYRDKPDIPWPTMRMAGREVFRWAIEVVPEVSRRAVAAAGLTMADVEVFVPHQANLRITEGIVQRLDLTPGTVVAQDVVDAGNTSSASIPLALDRLRELGQLPRGRWALLVGFGAGLSYAAQVVRLP
jgi:3-oxoacyl-[acyl-carrier-protein] synthase-3